MAEGHNCICFLWEVKSWLMMEERLVLVVELKVVNGALIMRNLRRG